jgi:Tfp pilus assembly protein PilF/nitrate/TMAO reductase-like tetraheme cytochrome c subunit
MRTIQVKPKRGGLVINSKLVLIGSLLLLGVAGAMLYAWTISGANAIFVDNQLCAGCHAERFQDWRVSQHEQAMQVANPQTVLANFNDATFSDGRVTSRFYQKDGQLLINTEGADGKFADYVVKYTIGITPLQQYLLELPKGRLQAFYVAWDTKHNRWFTLNPDASLKPTDQLHWTARVYTANSSCIECHSTNMSLNYDLKNDSYATTWSGVNVNCQTCHGPGSSHILWSLVSTILPMTNKGLVVDYPDLDEHQQVDICSRCHARRFPVGLNDAYDHPLLDDFMPELLDEGFYYADGQMLEEVFNYGSFLQAKMYQKGVTCTRCHNAHTLKLRRPGNLLCASCHQPDPPTFAYPTLKAKDYDSHDHHFHKADSTGAQCVNCHIPPTTYMVNDPRHDHSFLIPRPDLSLQWGTPNACAKSGCHLDQEKKPATEYNQWLVAAMDKWYGGEWKNRPSITGIITMARRGDPVAQIPLSQVISDPEKPAIVRATSTELLGRYGGSGLVLVIQQLLDPSPLVRVGAVRGVATLPNSQKPKLLEFLLHDPVRAVRVETVNVLASVPRSNFTDAQWASFTRAAEEYQAAQMAVADHPEVQLNLGQLYTALGQMDRAESAYQTAIERGPYFPPAHIRLATFYYQTGRVPKAEQTFQRALQMMPEQGTLYYSFGLLLAQQQRLPEAATNLAQASKILSNQSRVFYNYGLVLQKLGQTAQAETALRRAVELAPTEPDILLALATLYVNQKQWQAALPYAERLNTVRPNVSQFVNLLDSIRKEVQKK